MKNEFQLFDKKNKLLTYLFSEIDKVIDNNRKVKKKCLKILSCYFGSEIFRNDDGFETTILNEVRNKCKERGIFVELILTKNIYNQNHENLKGSKYFKAFPNNRDAFFHGKAVAYIHGSQKIIKNGDDITEIKITSGGGILIVTSANFSNAYIGNNIETGVLLNNRKTLESYLLEFEKSKGIKKKINDVIDYNSLYDVLSNGYILFKDDNTTLNNISTFHLQLKKNLDSNDTVNRIGGVITDGNLSVSLGKAGYYNIEEFEKYFPKPKSILSKYSLETPFGLWINKEIYNVILELYNPLLKEYKDEIRHSFTTVSIEEVANLVTESVTNSNDVMLLLKNNEDEIISIINEWKEGLIENIANDDVIKLMFYGYIAIEFPLDPNYTSALQQFIRFTKNMNYKNGEAKKPTKNIKNLLRPFIESESKDFNDLTEGYEDFKEKIKKEFKEKNENKVRLEYVSKNDTSIAAT